MAEQQLKVPDIGDFEDVEIIEVLVAPGDRIEHEQPLITLESDKASMEVPASAAGVVKELQVGVGDRVSQGSVILTLEAEAATDTDIDTGADAGAKPVTSDQGAESASGQASSSVASGQEPAPAAGETPANPDCDLLVLGAGPGGYSAAFRAADLGLKVILVDQYPVLGGVCLNVGCIPSKALLHAVKVKDEAEQMGEHGISFGKPKVNLDQLNAWKRSVVKQLTDGLAGLAKQRKVEVVTGRGRLLDSHSLHVEGQGETRTLSFRQCILATGSSPVVPPGIDMGDERIIDSTGALQLDEIPERFLVIGGGIIGLEMASVYSGLGSKVTVVELADRLLPGVDKDLVKVLRKSLDKRCDSIYLNTKVTAIKANKKSLTVAMEGSEGESSERFDKVLVAVGRSPNGHGIGLAEAGLSVDEQGFIAVDEHMRTAAAHIYAIGDLVGQPMLAHKAVHEGKIAAEVCSGERSAWDARAIPSVAYTDPEVAWVGLTEEQARAQGINYEKGMFPWAANGRALSLGGGDGLTKLLFDSESGRVIGGGIVGPGAGELIAEVVLAIEMGAEAHDIGLTVHPHPTLSETVAMAAEAAAGTLTDLIPKKKR
ncbi:dihydrolipoamide dehydrogenase of pyruvate dehydrogenase complex [Halorhodospira halochloris]|uniref:Dihydrolipoyl dehydrogenase n=1 Tax=Halorhodospira halochloris TaxID=1052 RepID=A0A120MZJ8_HALHR|nr:dihydrolipoyl dehydrogenase [Halorhodospira halochloris]MBK1650963.1 dihydrolipoyl dehydrogenase [Halorhodospira halochloris]BAU56531.1 dihydrolipoamide dehydrogenase of pyruvate dehydrogenase complex [Halorhodospira halochloris]